MNAVILLYFASILLIVYLLCLLKKSVSVFISIYKLNGPPKDNIIFGNMVALCDTPENVFKTMREWSRKYYPIYKIWIFNFSAANVVNPEDLELILSNPKHIDKSDIYKLLHNWLGMGLLTSTGSKWQTRRKVLTPAFHFTILQQFLTIFNEETEKLVQRLKEECHKPFIAINEHVTQFTLKTIAETAMGTKLQFNSKEDRDYKQAIMDLSQILIYKLMRPWFVLYKAIYFFTSKYREERKHIKILHKFTKNIIKEREESWNGNLHIINETNENKKRLAMLDLLLLAKNQDRTIDDEGIREEVDTFTFEGHDTTSAAICFALMILACHRSIQDQIVEELKEILGDLNTKPNYNDLQEMKFLDRCIKEVLRLYPSVPFISRQLGEDLTTTTGHFLPKESIVHVHIYDLHHNPAIYPDPKKFDPDRFLPENIKNRHPFAYLPFSAGQRNCIGQRFAILEIKTVLCGILSEFVLEPIDTPESITFVIDLVLRTKDSIRVKFVPRFKYKSD